jgi:aryl-alcohol dehydrogenase-like predicted oxidoreductase
MQMRELGRSGLTVSAIGSGCMGLSQAYGSADDAESLATLTAAFDAGCTLFDTAMSYGAGHNEELVGRALAGRRDQAVLATKFGISRGPDGVTLDARPERVREFCHASLARLRTDHLDLYYLHRVDPRVPVEETIGAMAGLVADGTVRHVGICEVDVVTLERAVATHPISALQFEWSLSWREPEDDVVPAARRLGVGLVPYSPLGRGLLTAALPATTFSGNDFRAGDGRFDRAALAHNAELVERLQELARVRGITVGQLALAWLLARGPDVVPIPGSRRAARVVENLAAADVALTPQEVAAIDAVAPRAAWQGDRRSFAAHGTTRTAVPTS